MPVVANPRSCATWKLRFADLRSLLEAPSCSAPAQADSLTDALLEAR
jgi:hypothetical protein